MDSVRFGRALGVGARSAAKALVGAVDAATAPSPTAKASPRPASRPAGSTASTGTPSGSSSGSAGQAAARVVVNVRETTKGVARGGRRFGEAIWGPFLKLSGVLWLEMTGAFFGIFALFAGQAVWSHRSDLQSATPNHFAHRNALVFLTMAMVFGYFCVSSFVRAWRKERSR